ncbi:MAG: hypothetical protein HGB31_08445 [Erysipelotrichaceae bacterium]|nr:hypothetical protein [Erysipelotrichaceae bacterium]
MLHEKLITKIHLEKYLFEIAKEYRHLAKKNAILLEIVLVGGASILINYDFRVATTDVDALYPTAAVFKQALKTVGDRYELDPKWFNADFMKTTSYSDKLREHSVFYKEYLHVLSVRTIKSEYLIAMKLKAGRMHKNDLSDIAGILDECQRRNEELSRDKIKDAVIELYGSLDLVDEITWMIFDQIMDDGDFKKLFNVYREIEQENRESLIEFEKEERPIKHNENFKDILQAIKEKKEKKQ